MNSLHVQNFIKQMVDSYPLVRNPTLESIAKFFLSFGRESKLFPIIFLGSIFSNRLLFGKSAVILFFVMIYNTLLKNIFKVRLNSHLGEGYSFPSGHMHGFGLFYGFLCVYSKNIVIKTILFIIVIGIGTSLVYMRYHVPFDVIGASFFLIFELILENYLSKKYGDKKVVLMIFGVTIINILGLIIMKVKLLDHIWLSVYGMIGAIIGFFYIKINGRVNFLQECFSLIILVGLNVIVFKSWSYFKFKQSFLTQIPFLFAPLSISLSLILSNYVNLPNVYIDDMKLSQNWF